MPQNLDCPPSNEISSTIPEGTRDHQASHPRTWVLYRPRHGTPWQGPQMPNWVGNHVESIIAIGSRTAVFAGRNGNL
jgi:hypothetical protein